MDKYFKNIDKQIEFNKGKNIFLDDTDSALKFIDETVNVFSNIIEISPDSERVLIDYATDKSLEEFCRINQYYTFSSQARNDLRSIYCDLLSSIRSNKKSKEAISKTHYDSIRQWLQRTNPFAYEIYAHGDPEITPVACSEYSAELQINVLKIDIKTLSTPVLDIGCGRKGNLVNYLCNAGIEAHGIDRFSFPFGTLVNSDWLEYNYGTAKWGTIISNLGFSNHFKHHNLREDGNYIEYGRKYMEIIQSLKAGGRFHYAPDLPFIEIYLDRRQFQIDKFDIAEIDFKTTIVSRLK